MPAGLVYNDGWVDRDPKKGGRVAMKLRNPMIAACVLLIVACNRQALPTQAPIESAAELEAAIEAAGVAVERVEGPAPEVAHTQAQVWQVRDDAIFVYSLDETADPDQVLAGLAGSETLSVQDDQQFQIWERDTFLVIYPGSEGGLVLLLSGLLGDPHTREISGPDEPYPPAVSAAQQKLADELNAAPAAIEVIDYEPIVWPDSCLGLPMEGETCAEVETPGWRVELLSEGDRYSLRTDEIGSRVRRGD